VTVKTRAVQFGRAAGRVWPGGISRGLVSVVLVTSVWGVCLGFNRGAYADSTRLDLIEWRDCASEDGSECGAISVPLNYDDPGGRMIELGVKRYRSSGAPDDRIGMIVYNPGGPGRSATEALGWFWDLLGKDVRRRFDLVAVDPRGVGESEPLQCEGGESPGLSFTVFPANGTQLIEQMTVYDAWLRQRCPSSEELLSEMGSRVAARDIESLRVALGEDQITYVGSSYGSVLGTSYVVAYPERVRALVLDAPVDPSIFDGADSQESFWRRLRTPEASEDSFWSAVGQCERASLDACPVAPYLRASYQALTDYLSRQPLYVDGYGWFDLSAFQDLVVNLLYRYDEQGVDDIQLLFHQIVVIASLIGNAPLPNDPADSLGIVHLDMADSLSPMLAVVCSDFAGPDTPDEFLADAEAAEASAPGFGLYWVSQLSSCVGSAKLESELAWDLSSSLTTAPLLVLANEHDPVTDVLGAERSSRISSQGHLLVVQNSWGHGVNGRSACAEDARDAFLIDPAANTPQSCPPNSQLFPDEPGSDPTVTTTTRPAETEASRREETATAGPTETGRSRPTATATTGTMETVTIVATHSPLERPASIITYSGLEGNPTTPRLTNWGDQSGTLSRGGATPSRALVGIAGAGVLLGAVIILTSRVLAGRPRITGDRSGRHVR